MVFFFFFRYFDRDIECIFKFFRKRLVVNRVFICLHIIYSHYLVAYDLHMISIFLSSRFNISFQEDRDDETEVEVDENSRPSFYDITKDANALDRELEASGFTKKEQNDLDKVCEPITSVMTLVISLGLYILKNHIYNRLLLGIA